MQTTATPRVAVVGAGLAGLAASISVTRSGASVTFFERSGEPGGRAATQVEHGFHFNIGPHALYHDAHEMLRGLGVQLTGGHPPLSRTVAFYRGKRYRLPLGGPSLLATGFLRLHDKLEAGRFFAGRFREEPASLQSFTVRDWLDSALRPGPARELAEALVRVASYANAPDIASAGAHLQQLQAAGRHPVFYVDGGWQTIVDGLRARLAEAGGTIRTGTRIDAIEPSPAGGWLLRSAAGESHEADAVIVAAGPGDARRLVRGPAADTLQRWDERATPVRVAALDIGLSRIPLPRVNYSIGIDRPLYFSVHSKAAKLAPENGAVIHAAMYLDPGKSHDAEANLRELEAMVDDLQPGWRDLVVHRRFLPNMTVTNAVVDAARGGYPGRPGPEVPAAPGLFVAGDWVGPTGMLADAALASGTSAGRLAATAVATSPEAVAVA